MTTTREDAANRSSAHGEVRNLMHGGGTMIGSAKDLIAVLHALAVLWFLYARRNADAAWSKV